MSQGYDPNRSQVKNDKLAEFIQSSITGDLEEVPGIGPAAKQKLSDKGISTTFALIGQFLLLKEEGVGPVEHCDRFWYWLHDAGVNSYRSGIVRCIAEKVDTMFPGIYDASQYPSTDA
eukprot:CAMPEP_0174819426 /NCGR_PEP_ID=MMETSP1107-20130205/2646_1 /TAXON_ID=36770 /ORGANISM="Paraphysomonas vestita, Strain GFlagA" /LENGTH=117 /DNA_ID=CAMNT_0016032879 /DNA_START=34 /DNA_END=387 /DNA_ORIENTATION=-